MNRKAVIVDSVRKKICFFNINVCKHVQIDTQCLSMNLRRSAMLELYSQLKLWWGGGTYYACTSIFAHAPHSVTNSLKDSSFWMCLKPCRVSPRAMLQNYLSDLDKNHMESSTGSHKEWNKISWLSEQLQMSHSGPGMCRTDRVTLRLIDTCFYSETVWFQEHVICTK